MQGLGRQTHPQNGEKDFYFHDADITEDRCDRKFNQLKVDEKTGTQIEQLG